jgi:hypothetical protein
LNDFIDDSLLAKLLVGHVVSLPQQERDAYNLGHDNDLLILNPVSCADCVGLKSGALFKIIIVRLSRLLYNDMPTKYRVSLTLGGRIYSEARPRTSVAKP